MNAQTARAATHNAGPTLRDRYDVRFLFGNRFQVTNLGNGHRHYVGVAFLEGEFVARHECLAKRYGAAKCAHELAAERHERQRLNKAMAEYFN